jgi:NADH-quinone oxidoreductase subunit N
MILAYVFISITAIMLFFNLALNVAKRRSLQLAANAALLSILSMLAAYMLYSGYIYTAAGTISFNPFSLFFILVFTLGILLVNVLAYGHSEDYGSFALLASFALIGMYLVSSSTSLITIFLGLELASIPTVFIVLISRKSLEAAAKFFIMASIAVASFSFAMALVYGGTNALSLSTVPKTALMAFASVLFIASIGFDASIFPFNIFIPDVYNGAPAYVTSMLGGINKKMGFAALIQVIILLFITSKSPFIVLAILSVFTMFYGNLAALRQENLKRLLAYSSISQAGYMLIGIAISTQYGIGASLFQIFAHMFIFIGLLGIVGWLEGRDRHRISDLIGLSGENRFAAIAMTIFMLSLVGLPFTTGFVGKFLLFLGAVRSGFAWLAIIGIINSIISVYYYARPIMAAYTGRAGEYKIRMHRSTLIVISACLAITLVLGIFPSPLISITSNAGAYLFNAH